MTLHDWQTSRDGRRIIVGKTKAPEPDETEIHVSIYRFLCAVLPQPFRVVHVPNGGMRDKDTAAALKRMGTLAGVHDLLVFLPVGRLILFEVKTDRGRLSHEQSEFHAFCSNAGFEQAIVRSIADVRLALDRFGVKTRESR